MALVSPVEAPTRISDAIRRASAATGVDFQYLLTTAARESNFKTQAKARTSSAAGLFQFIESTWLQTLKEEGARFGLEKYSPHIFRTSGGRYYVPNRQIRAEILKLRHDPDVASVMAGAFTQQNAEYVGNRLGREPTQGELYIAHFLGRGGATRLITLAQQSPSARADAHFPRAAAANRGIFYSNGQPRTLSQVYDLLVSDHSRLEALTIAAADRAQAQYTSETAPENDAGQPLPPQTASSVAEDTGLATDSLATLFGEARPAGLIARTRVAALAAQPAGPGVNTITDAGLGGIGPWHTMIQRDEPVRNDTVPASAAPPDDGPATAPVRRPALAAQPRRSAARQSPQPAAAQPARNSIPAAAAYATLASRGIFGSNYWMNISLSGS